MVKSIKTQQVLLRSLEQVGFGTLEDWQFEKVLGLMTGAESSPQDSTFDYRLAIKADDSP